MKLKEVEFVLPIGYEDEKGTIHRKGKMRMATALDEIEVNNNDKTAGNHRMRDLLMLSRVILHIGDVDKVDQSVIETLFEADFIFLQMLYNRLNKDNTESVIVRCPNCSNLTQTSFPDLYKDLHHYFARNKEAQKSTSEIREVPSKPENRGS